MAVVSLEETKQYLRVDFDDDDELIETLIDTAERLCRDVARVPGVSSLAAYPAAKPAVLYTVAYLYEHREDADHRALTLTLRSLLFGIRKEKF